MENLLVISDLHLGEHLRAEARDERADATDSALIGFLDHHTRTRESSVPWRLVINGDMVDFVAVRLIPEAARGSDWLDADEGAYGLTDCPRSALVKMHAVLHHHDEVFRSLARFVGAGNRLDMVIGNHDAAFHWPEVQAVLRHALASTWESLPEAAEPGARTAEEVREAIEFHAWFWFQEGVAWIEHGHQFDPYCSFEDVVTPDTAEGELDQNIGSALMHFVGNHYLSDMEHHWGKGFFGYLQFLAEQGFWRGASLLAAYADMCLHLVAVWWDRRPQRLAERKRRNAARLERLAERARVPLRVLLRLRSMHRRPAAADLDAILRAVMFDRLMLLVAIPAVAGWALLMRPEPILGAILAGAVLGPLAALAARPRDPVDPRLAMRRMSRVIRRLVRVPIVVFGHSHAAVAENSRGGWYFNTGSWVGDPDGPGRAFTHLRVLQTPQGWSPALCQWRDGASEEI